MTTFTLRLWVALVIWLIWFIFWTFKVIFRKPLMDPNNTKGSFRDWYEAHIKGVDLFNKTLMGLALAFTCWYFTGPFLLDIPAMITNNYEVVEGTVLSKSYQSRYSDRLVKIEDDETGEVVTVEINYTAAHKGDHLTVKYLKHTKRGIVTEHTKRTN